MAIKDLSPKDANSSGRIIKNLRICGSGLYEYHVSEAPIMGITIPGDYKDETFFVYRPAEVLEKNKDLYARVPIITGHHVRVTTQNAKQLAVGMVGDTVKSEVGEDGETYLYTTGTIIAGDGIEAYERYGELSVGYDPILAWCPGDYKGQQYQVVLKGFDEINHLLICKTARGGHQCRVMDSLPEVMAKFKHINSAGDSTNGGKPMGIFSKIFGKPAVEKPAMNGDARVASALLQSIKAGADCKTQVLAVKTMLGDNIDDTLKGYFEDLTGDEVAKATKDEIAKAVDVVDKYITDKLAGDEEVKSEDKPAGDEHPADCTCEKCKAKAAGDEPPCDEPEKKQTGDSIDYEKLATMVVDKLKSEPKEPKAEMGDEANALEQSRVAMLLTGDEKDATVSSDKLMKEIWG